ncbi:MAG: extracellular solute-binding protein [Thermoprotei archaeon]
MNRNVLIGIVVVVIVAIAVAGYFATMGPSSSAPYSTSQTGTEHNHSTTPTSVQTSKTSRPSGVPTNVLLISTADAFRLEGDAYGKVFQQATGIQYKVASSGSFDLARKIAAGVVPTTVFMPIADTAIYPQYLGNYSPGWAIGLATDQLVLAYSNATLKSPVAVNIIKLFEEAKRTNSSTLYAYAFGNLTSGQVKVGIANPLADPAGLRGWLSLRAASYAFANDPNYYVNRILANGGNVTAAHAAELVPALTTGNIDFLFIYKSAAKAQKLNYIQLPPQTNFGDPQYAGFYKKVTYEAGGRTFKGGLIVLWITIPLNTNNETLGFQFVKFVLDHPEILDSFGLSVIQKPLLEVWVPQDKLPPQVQEFIQSGKFKVINEPV